MNIPTGKKDGFFTPPVGAWSEEKYRVVWYYDRLFSTGMKNKWPSRVYIDLFAGAGYAQIRNTDRIVKSSALLAMDVKDPFVKYVFCDKKKECVRALEERVSREHPELDATVIHGDCNIEVHQVVDELKMTVDLDTSLTFCLIDPFGLRFSFDTIATLMERCKRIDFLVLLALEMDGRRNEARYVDGESDVVDALLSSNSWREDWYAARESGEKFTTFVSRLFAEKMMALGFLPEAKDRMKHFTTGDPRVPLYHLAFFSKNPRGYDFWRKIQPYAGSQQRLDL